MRTRLMRTRISAHTISRAEGRRVDAPTVERLPVYDATQQLSSADIKGPQSIMQNNSGKPLIS